MDYRTSLNQPSFEISRTSAETPVVCEIHTTASKNERSRNIAQMTTYNKVKA